jgi:cytochrome c
VTPVQGERPGIKVVLPGSLQASDILSWRQSVTVEFRRTGAALRVSINRCNQAATIVAMAAMLLISNSARSLPSGDAVRGATIYRGCMACHSLEKNVVGPKHEGVFGAKAGAVPDFRYSDALKNSGIVWNEDMLDKWLANPQTLVPGTTMFYLVKNAQDRADVIAFLKEKSGK